MIDQKYNYHRFFNGLTMGALLLGGCTLPEDELDDLEVMAADEASDEQTHDQNTEPGEPLAGADALASNADPESIPAALGLDTECARRRAPIVAKVPEGPNGNYVCAFPGMPNVWQASSLFAQGSPWLKQALETTSLPQNSPLHAYCLYQYTGNNPMADYAAFFPIASEHTIGAATDCPSMTTQAGLDTSGMLDATSDEYTDSVGALTEQDLNTYGSSGLGFVHTYLLDTKQENITALDPHADRLRTMLQDLACADDRAGCRSAIHEILVTPLRDSENFSTSHWGANNEPDAGGSHGYVHQTSLGVALAVQDFIERNADENPLTLERGIINMSIGAIDSGSYATDPAYAPMQSLADAMRMASCYGLPMFAAAGNRNVADTNCVDPGSDMTYPAAFESVDAPTEVECQLWGYVPDWNVNAYPVHGGPALGLVTAVGAVDHGDRELSTNRIGGMPRLVAPAFAALTPSGTTPTTGTSAATVVATAATSMLLSLAPDMHPGEAVEQLYMSGYTTGLTATDGKFANTSVRRVSVCASFDAWAGFFGCDAPAPDLDASATIAIATADAIADAQLTGHFASPGGTHVAAAPVCEQTPLDLIMPQPYKPGCANCSVGIDAGAGGMETLYMTIQPVQAPVTMTATKAVLYMSDSLEVVTSYDLSEEAVAEINSMDSTKVIEVLFSHPDPKDAWLEIEYVDDGETFSITESNPLWVWYAAT